MERKKVILDMDPGVDDALAIILALRSPELEVLAITTVAGNVGIEHCVKNTLRVLALLGIKDPPPVARGASKPLKAKPYDAASVHGADGLGDLGDKYYPKLGWDAVVKEPAADLIARIVAEHPGEVTILAEGPITNVAEAIRRHPKEMAKARGIQAMTGAVRVPGNIPPLGAAEFDAYVDPHALEEVLAFTVPVLMVPLDVTHTAPLRREIAQWEFGKQKDRISRFVLDATVHYMDFHRDVEGFDGCYLHDPLSMAIAAFPTIARTEAMRIHVDTSEGLTRGMTLPYRHAQLKKPEPNCQVAVKIDTERFTRVFMERVRGGRVF